MSVTARIRVEVEVTVGTWGQKNTVADMVEVAKQEGTQKLSNMIYKGGGKIVGEPKVILVVGTED
ncbi:hypothetical protein BcepF1.023 [Burkholderia phage BcepF1]|uniref:Uncharacterized protein n=1 Tax=Burkholderia phage BcepF1 TaxID=2886897 RepID=A1YZS7_9CAUD|nr:hypothetical protein BcepF1.023 [Burkholderia phage BcepF1]ABL96754.1 hypothetical protein BcepF1.023 [Burkholderia phage BcepF1]